MNIVRSCMYGRQGTREKEREEEREGGREEEREEETEGEREEEREGGSKELRENAHIHLSITTSHTVHICTYQVHTCSVPQSKKEENREERKKNHTQYRLNSLNGLERKSV